MRARIQSGRRRYYRAGLRAWFERHGRDLPWRRTRDPYRILVSELMLHQTQVPRVAEVYETFLHRFPTIESVAEAPLGEVKAITDPLGYKIRGRWIKQIADETVAYHAGRLPDSVEGLMELPGVGRYTAGAVATFAYDQAAPILDTNVARVVGRWFQGALPDTEPDGRRERRLWALAADLLPRRAQASGTGPSAAWITNQGLMDLGAQLCVSRRPRCESCPFRRRCHHASPARAAGEADVIEWIGERERSGGVRS